MATSSCGGVGDDSSVVLEEKKKLWIDAVRTKINKQQTTTKEMVIKKVMVEMNTMPNIIPDDIVAQIFSWLPTKSLAQFRWACKYWFNLITRDSSFFNVHLHHSSALDQIFGIISLSVLSFSYKCAGDRYRIFQSYLDYNNTTRTSDVSSKVSFALPPEYVVGSYRPEILGSCNGLLFLCQSKNISKSESDNLCIWNPFTKEYRFLPHPLDIIDTRKEVWVGGVKTKTRRKSWWVEVPDSCKYGFGYDHTTNDFKVIRNAYYNVTKVDPAIISKKKKGDLAISEEDPVLRSDVQVYTLGTNSWRRIEPNPYILRHERKEGVFANGALYWIDSEEKQLISFDIRKEKFQFVSKIPKLNNHDDYWHHVRIQVFEGSLCVVLNFKDPGRYRYRSEMWVMEDYAVNNNMKNESSWTMLSTITKPQNPAFSIKPLRFTRNGQILMVTNEKDLLLYDPRTGNDKILCRICQDNNHFIQEVHTESLVSLNSRTYSGQERRKEETKFSQEEEDAMMALEGSIFAL